VLRIKFSGKIATFAKPETVSGQLKTEINKKAK
jgi:hypothetical protein